MITACCKLQQAVTCLAAVFILLVLILLVLFGLILLVFVLVLLFVHDLFLQIVLQRYCKDSLPRNSGFILRFED